MKSARILVIAAIVVIAWSLTLSRAYAQPQMVNVSGHIYDENGESLQGVNVYFYIYAKLSFEITEQYYRFTTDASGAFSGQIDPRARYIVYIVGSSIDEYIPVKIDLSEIDTLKVNSIRINVKMKRAATVRISGSPIFIGGIPLRYTLTVLNRDGQPYSKAEGTVEIEEAEQNLTLMPEYLHEYGQSNDAYILAKISSLSMEKAYVPYEEPVRLKFLYTVFDERDRLLKKIETTLGSYEAPLEIGDEGYLVDVTHISLKADIETERRDIDYARRLIAEYEALGFYLVEENRMLQEAEKLVNDAQRLWSEGKGIDDIVPLLEKVYTLTRDIIPRKIHFARDIAWEGGIVLPVFLALFSAIVAYYFFEDNRKKMMMFFGTYILMVLLFAQLYPGFPLLWKLNREIFLAATSASFLGIFAFFYLFERYFEEIEVPTKITSMAAISTAFMLAKRFSKLKKFRTSITIFSITILIWAVVTLASFSTVYVKVTSNSPIDIPPGQSIITIRRVTNETVSPLNPLTDYQILSHHYTLYPRIQDDLSKSVEIIVKGKVVHHIAGVDPKDPILGKYISLNYGEALLPKSFIGLVRPGENITLKFESPEMKFKLNLKVAGFLGDEIATVRDPDGLPPIVTHPSIKEAQLNTSDIIFVNRASLEDALKGIVSPFSKSIKIYTVVMLGVKNTKTLANDLLERRGGDYIISFCSEGTCKILKYGVKVQGIVEQGLAFLVPIFIVAFNVLATMVSIVRERRREIFIFVTAGFNPLHVALVFLAEAVIYGLISGGLGYVLGMATFKLAQITAISENVLLREKLEWYWGFLAIVISVIVSILGAFKPAMDAAFMFSPTKEKKIKVEAHVKEKRRERISATMASKIYTFSQRISEVEVEIFQPFVVGRLSDLKYGMVEKVENIKEHEEEERPDGTRIRRITFDYILSHDVEKPVTLESELRIIKDAYSENYRVELEVRPKEEAPITLMEHVARIIRDILKDWEKEKDRLL